MQQSRLYLNCGKTHKSPFVTFPHTIIFMLLPNGEQELVVCLWPHLKLSITTLISFPMLQGSAPRESTVGYWNRLEVGLAPQPVFFSGRCIITVCRIFPITYSSGMCLPSLHNKRLAHACRQEDNEPFSTSFSFPSFNQTF